MRHSILAAALGLAVLAPVSAQAASLRVVTPERTIFADTYVGSARAYLDSRGTAHKLKPRTALGQLVSATGYTGTGLTAVYTAGLGAYVTKIAGVSSPKTGYWSLIVNNVPAMVGAGDTQLKATDEVIWIADTDYSSKNGPFVYDLDATKNADGTVTFAGFRVGGAKPKAAAGAVVTVNGTISVTLDANGSARVVPPAQWSASIGSRGNVIASETLTG